ncbi:MAG: hypothetical protein IT195_05660 [Microthrixaceae bacterium]|nr:hypothetical protein [Microthrixaceae bacterium]
MLAIGRDSVTGKRRRASRTVEGTARDAEVALARLKVADHERRLPSGGTRAHSVGAALDQYLEAIAHGLIELAPSTVLTSRSAIRTMKAIEMPDGRVFGNVRLSKLGWQDIEHLYAGIARLRPRSRLDPEVRHGPHQGFGARPETGHARLQPVEGRSPAEDH